MDSAYDGVDKEGVLQEGLGALTDSVINRHIQLYPGGITNGTSSMKNFLQHILKHLHLSSNWLGGMGGHLFHLYNVHLHNQAAGKRSLPRCCQPGRAWNWGMFVGLLRIMTFLPLSLIILINSCPATLLCTTPPSLKCHRSVGKSSDNEQRFCERGRGGGGGQCLVEQRKEKRKSDGGEVLP